MGLLKHFETGLVEAGCDEVGRGCLSGPVVAAAVVLDENFSNDLINDSKKLSAKARGEMETYIKQHVADFAVAELDISYIDQHNILNASIHAMHRAIDQLTIRPELILVDGNRFHPYPFVPHRCFVQGDSKLLSIACASIIAKEYRDRLMLELHEEYPQYGWNENKGYATKKHREALMKYGPTPYHRKSFKLIYT